MAVALSSVEITHPLRALREDILASPVAVARHRLHVFTAVYQANEGMPWQVKKAMALRRYFETVPLYIRDHDGLAGSISETPGAMPLFPEIGLVEHNGLGSEKPRYKGYFEGVVPEDIAAYWEDRNLYGRFRAYMRAVKGIEVEREKSTNYKFISNQGHLSPSYVEVLKVGLDGMVKHVHERQAEKTDPDELEFLAAAEHGLLGLIAWAERYGAFLAAAAAACDDAARADELREMARICSKIAHEPPGTFREAMQLIWLCQQAIHVEGHGYSCTPDRVDQLLFPYYEADTAAGRIDEDEALRLCGNFILKQRDNTFWSVQHNLTQGLCVGGSTPDGKDQTNALSWMFITATNMASVPEPLVWVRWHPNIDQDFFDYCLESLAGSTCFPLMLSDAAVPDMFMALGVSCEDAYDYVPAGCNELAIPGRAYFNPCGHISTIRCIELALTHGRGYKGYHHDEPAAPPPSELKTFEAFADAVGAYMRKEMHKHHHWERNILMAQMRWGQTPLTSCFFHDCIDEGHDLTTRTRYNILSMGGNNFPNSVDAMAAIREVVYEKGEATLEDFAKACAANYEGYEELRAKILAAPKHGNDHPRLRDIVTLIEKMRDGPMEEFCRDPRDGTRMGSCHVVRDGGVRSGLWTPATPDGRLAGEAMAASVAAAHGREKSGPTAVLNSVLMLNARKSWRSGYNCNIRFQPDALLDPASRAKVRQMLNAFFKGGGQELQVNCVDSDILRDAQQHPEKYGDLVVRVAGMSALFVNLDEDTQNNIISRTEHG